MHQERHEDEDELPSKIYETFFYCRKQTKKVVQTSMIFMMAPKVQISPV